MKKLLLIGLGLLLSVFLVMAITLTKEATDRVEIPSAIKGTLCRDPGLSSSTEDCGKVVVGLALAYPIGSEEGHEFMMFSFKNNIYRATSGNYYYNETTGELLHSSGKCSVLDPQAENGERLIDCRYFLRIEQSQIVDMIVSFDKCEEYEGPKFKDNKTVEGQGCRFPEATSNYKLVSIEGTARNIVWHPGEGELE